MSAADWVRIKRLRGATNYVTDKTSNLTFAAHADTDGIVSPPGCSVGNVGPIRRTDNSRIVGSSRIRREASKWIDYRASQVQDYTLYKEATQCATCGLGSFVTRTTLCNCTTARLPTKVGPLLSRNPVGQHLRM